jgi:hypothetical protein
MAGGLQGYVTNKTSGVAITDFYITIDGETVFPPAEGNPWPGTNYYYFEHSAGTWDMYCHSDTHYKVWSRTVAQGNAIIIVELKTKLLNIRMTPK